MDVSKEDSNQRDIEYKLNENSRALNKWNMEERRGGANVCARLVEMPSSADATTCPRELPIEEATRLYQ
jgi:hypothetical protein